MIPRIPVRWLAIASSFCALLVLTGCLTEEDLGDACAPGRLPEFEFVLANDPLGDSPIPRDETQHCSAPAAPFDVTPQTHVNGVEQSLSDVARGDRVTYSFEVPGDGACRDPSLSTNYSIPVEGRGQIASTSDTHFFIPAASSTRYAVVTVHTLSGCSGQYGFDIGSDAYSFRTR